jgi:hypothetical protein
MENIVSDRKISMQNRFEIWKNRVTTATRKGLFSPETERFRPEGMFEIVHAG